MKKVKKISIKAIAIMLSVLTVLFSFPLSVFAQETVFTEVTDEERAETEKAIVELKEERTANTKRFRLANGSYMVAQYETDVHYMDEEGVWQDIDNTLTESGGEISTGNARIKLAKKITGNGQLLTLHDGNKKLTLSLDGATKKVTGEITACEPLLGEDAPQLQKMITLDKLSASVRYAGILPGVDLEYVIKGMDIKENIIVKERGDSYSYSFTLSLNHLTACPDGEGGIALLDSVGEAAYLIPAPVMWDAAGVSSERVSLSLTDLGNGKYTLTVIADSEWMNAAERAYPITIDPPLYYRPSGYVTDLYVSSSAPSANYNSSTLLYADDTKRIYWKTSVIPTLPAGYYMTDAVFEAVASSAGDGEGYIGAYEVLSDWDSTLTYSQITSQSKGTISANFTDYDVSTAAEDLCQWNITPIVKRWYDGQNYGLALTGISGGTYDITGAFYSNEAALASSRPRLCITYRDMKGLEDYWTTSSQSAGFAGAGSVNHATGGLTFAIPTLTTTDSLMPYTPTLVHNTAMAGKAYDNGSFNVAYEYGMSYAPTGYKFSMQETVTQATYYDASDNSHTAYIWADADGTQHYFSDEDGDDIYEDEDGLLLSLRYELTTYDVTITDSNDTVRRFTQSSEGSGWVLNSITDQNGNRLQFVLSGTDQVSAVMLYPNGSSNGSSNGITQLSILYRTDGLPYAVLNPNANEAVVFFYAESYNGAVSTSGSWLRKVVRVHHTGSNAVDNLSAFYNTNSATSSNSVVVDAVADYTYDSTGRLTEVQNNLSKYKVKYTYTNGRVTAVEEYETASGAAGQKLTFTYGTSNTELRTSGTDDIHGNADDLITVCAFDDQGRTVSCYTTNVERTVLYSASHGEYVSDEENEKAKNNFKTSVQTAQHSSNYLLNGGFENGSSYWSVNTGGDVSIAGGTANLRVSDTVPLSTLTQRVTLPAGDYCLSVDISTWNMQNVDVFLCAEAEFQGTMYQVAVDEYSATSGVGFASLEIENDADISGGYDTFDIWIEVNGSPEDQVTVTVDNFMLSRTTGPADYEMLTLGHFENTNTLASVETAWQYNGEPSVDITRGTSSFGGFGRYLSITSAFGTDDYEIVEQVAYQATSALKTSYQNGSYVESESRLFTLSGWGKGSAQSYNTDAIFALGATVTYYRGDGTTVTTAPIYFAFDKSITDWQFVSGGFVTDPSMGMVDTVTIRIVYKDHPGTGCFDEISLVEDSNQTGSYTYTEHGYVESYKNGRNSIWYEYDTNNPNRVIRVISSNKTYVCYAYDAWGRINKEQHYKYSSGFYNSETKTFTSGTVETLDHQIEYSYNVFGQVIETVTCESDAKTLKSITRASYETDAENYPHILGALRTQTNALSEITRYFYDTSNGRLLAVTYPDGNGVTYTYDVIGNLIQVLPAELNDAATGYDAISSSASVNYTYDALNRLQTIQTATTAYTFTYDNFGNSTNIQAGGNTLASYEYNANNGKLSILTYGNGLKVKYLYDSLDRVEQVWYNKGEKYTDGTLKYTRVYSYSYNSAGALYSITDHRESLATYYQYDREGRVVRSYTADLDTDITQYGMQVGYDSESRLSHTWYAVDYAYPTGMYVDSTGYYYSYDAITGKLKTLKYKNGDIIAQIMPQYDALGRTTSRSVYVTDDYVDGFSSTYTYDYHTEAGIESGQVSQVTSEILDGNGDTVTANTLYYTYDANGNITQITNASGVIQNKYYYDDLGQLVREDNRAFNQTYVWTYDNAGNILSKATYAFTTGTLPATATSTIEYSYATTGWKDQLVGYDGEAIGYDAIGNPTVIGYGENYQGDWIWSEGVLYEWEGRQLVRVRSFYNPTYSNDTTGWEFITDVSYTYNADGIRTGKVSDGTVYEYIVNGSQLLGMRWTYNSVEYYISYIYDETGAPIGMKYRTNNYAEEVFDYFFFEKNLQGDVVAVYNADGSRIAGYMYDAWGRVSLDDIPSGLTYAQTMAIGAGNPFRYRGYIYESDIGCYYLQSRFYNPAWGRFLNADGYVSTGTGLLGYNMYAYCNNNPVMFCDHSGACLCNPSGNCIDALAGNPCGTSSTGPTATVMPDGATIINKKEYEAYVAFVNGETDYYDPIDTLTNTATVMDVSNDFAKLVVKNYDEIFEITGKSIKVLDFAVFAIDTQIGYDNNIANGAGAGKIAYDVGVDIAFFAGEMAFTAGATKLGTVIGTALFPGPGTAAGAVIGFAFGTIATLTFTYYIEPNAKPWAKGWVQ